MPWFRQKPMLVEAVRYDGTNDAECSAFSGQTVCGTSSAQMMQSMSLTSPSLIPNVGDWIYRDPSGVVTIMSDEQFKQEFETV